MAAEKQTSVSTRPSTALPYSSQVQYGLAWLCTVPLGRPVDPLEYSQKAGSSAPVAAGFCSGAALSRKLSNSTSAGCSGATGCDTTTFCTSWSLCTMPAVSAGSSAPDTSTAWARLCSSM